MILFNSDNLQEAKKYDLTKATKDKFNEHEKLSHHIISNRGAIKSAEKTLKELNEMELSREFEIKALKRRIIPQIIMTVIVLISMFAFEQKKLSFDYLFKLVLVIGICAFIFYRSLRKFQNSKYSLYIKGNTVKIFYENKKKIASVI